MRIKLTAEEKEFIALGEAKLLRGRTSSKKAPGPMNARAAHAAATVALSGRVSSRSASQNAKHVRSFMTEKEIASLRGPVSFLGSTSVKVLHSAMERGYLNIVQYLAPANRGAYSLLAQFPNLRSETGRHGSLAEMWEGNLHTLSQNMKHAAKEDSLWAGFGTVIQGADATSHVISIMDRTASDSEAYHKEDFAHTFLNLCPSASKDCRNVCLNTSGKGGAKDSGLYHSLVVKPALAKGERHFTDPRHMHLRGLSMAYGGAPNTTLGARLRRTHVMLLSWLREGVLDNTYNEMIHREALMFAEEALKDRRVYNEDGTPPPLALRLNGTSDIPFHTIRSGGKNMMQQLGKAGFTCYDYTKHFEKQLLWMRATPRGAYKPIDNGSVKIVGTGPRSLGFPSNYFVAFSRSETNAAHCLKVLQDGGNVVAVLRRSVEATKDVIKLSAVGTAPERYKDQTTYMPTVMALGELDPKLSGYGDVDVFNGDAHDLRFLDPYHVGEANKGSLIGLIAKGSARAPLKDEPLPESGQYPVGFGTAVRLTEEPRRLGGPRAFRGHASRTRNPGEPAVSIGPGVEPGAVTELSPEVLEKASHRIAGGWAFVPTGLAT